ncbi:hypothetical protein QO017_005546 [Methylobacterium gregans]|nr:hypothetical protein [Methylobacterium gregans]
MAGSASLVRMSSCGARALRRVGPAGGRLSRLDQARQRLGLRLRDLPLPVGAPEQRRHLGQGESGSRLDRAADLVCKHVSRPLSTGPQRDVRRRRLCAPVQDKPVSSREFAFPLDAKGVFMACGDWKWAPQAI